MTKLTTEHLEKLQDNLLQFQDSYSDPADKENYDIFVDALHALDEFKAAKEKLLAYEQAAEKPYGYLEPCDFPRTTATVYPEKDKYAFMPLYTAPILPKQPELLSIGELLQRLEVQTGEKWVEESAQHVIPGQLTQRMAEEKALSLGAVLYDEEADIFADGWNACRAEMLKAQPVSEPYKLAEITDGWVACNERMPEPKRWLALYGARVFTHGDKSGQPYEELCVDQGYLGCDGKFYLLNWDYPGILGDNYNNDLAVATHWMYWELPEPPMQEIE